MKYEQTEIVKIEKEIINIVGNNPRYLTSDLSDEAKTALKLLFEQRRSFLNEIFQWTPEHIQRIRLVNNLLKELNYSLYEREAAFEYNASELCCNSSFGDDFDMGFSLRFSWNDNSSVSTLGDEEYYCSNFNLMCAVIDRYFPQSSLVSTKMQKKIDELNLEIQASTPHNISLCYAAHSICFMGLYSIPDFIRLNDFCAEASFLQRRRIRPYSPSVQTV